MEMLFYTYLAMCVIMTPVMLARRTRRLPPHPAFHRSDLDGADPADLLPQLPFHGPVPEGAQETGRHSSGALELPVTFFGVPIAALWLGERLTLAAVAGGVLVLASTLLITFWEHKQAALSTPAT